jgi:hypothetical protein
VQQLFDAAGSGGALVTSGPAVILLMELSLLLLLAELCLVLVVERFCCCRSRCWGTVFVVDVVYLLLVQP